MATSSVLRGSVLSARLVAVLVGGVLLLLLNVFLLTHTEWTMVRGGGGADWTIFGEAGRRAIQGGPRYASEDNNAIRYSPLLAYVFAVITPMGALVWRALHLVAAAALAPRSPWLALLVFLSWPFWFDVEAGNIMVFVLLFAVWAVESRRWAIAGFLALLLLAPRPLMLPVGVWLLWKHPAARLPFAIAFVAQGLAVLVLGWAPEWIGALVNSSSEMGSVLNFGPSQAIGWLWVPIGLAVAAFATRRRRLGIASLAASPYWLPYYFLMLFLELVGPSTVASVARTSRRMTKAHEN
jgi:hypothetical protein